jgi:molecular chaperone DnaJ
MQVSLAEAAFGTKKELPLGHASPCDVCQGTGAEGGELVTCSTCGGRGQVAHQRGGFLLSTTCPSCRGQGSRAKNACDACQGSGEVHQDRKVEVNVPAGIDEGQTLRLTGLGQAGRLGGPPGDLYVSVMVESDARFEREQNNLYYDLHVSYPQAALGAKVVVPSIEPPPEGEDELTFEVVVPPGIQPGELIRVPGGGVPYLGQRGRGDLVCVVQVDVPKDLSPRAQELIQELAKSFDA